MNIKIMVIVCWGMSLLSGLCVDSKGQEPASNPQFAMKTAVRSTGSTGPGIYTDYFTPVSSKSKDADVGAGKNALAASSSQCPGADNATSSVSRSAANSDSIQDGAAYSAGRLVGLSSQEDEGVSTIGKGELLPFDIWTSGGAQDYSNGWSVLDGSLNTAWDGVSATGGCWIVFTYDSGVVVSNADVLFSENSTTNVMMLGAVDVDKWVEYPVGAPFEVPVLVNYLWFIFPANFSGGLARVSEIVVDGETAAR